MSDDLKCERCGHPVNSHLLEGYGVVACPTGLPVWGCFRTVGVNRVRHAPHDWVQGDLKQIRCHCDGAE